MENLKFSCGSSLKNWALPKVEMLDFDYELSLFKMNKNAYLIKSNHSKETRKNSLTKSEHKDKETEVLDQGFTLENILKEKKVGSFKLCLHSSIEEPILKGKYFSFKVLLTQMGVTGYPIKEIIELDALVYNNEGVEIKKNMKGLDILRGNHKQNMHFYPPEQRHVAFFRIQFSEVSSHYINKTINLAIKARNSEFLRKTGWFIEPIVLENLVVKAKKSKK